MNIYLLAQTDNPGYDTYDSCIVYAESEDEAKCIPYSLFRAVTWAYSPDNVTAAFLGTACVTVTQARMLMASFNAG